MVAMLGFLWFLRKEVVYFLVDLILDFLDPTIEILLLLFMLNLFFYSESPLSEEVDFEEVVYVSLFTECPHLLTSFNSLQELAKFSKTSGSTELNLFFKVSLELSRMNARPFSYGRLRNF